MELSRHRKRSGFECGFVEKPPKIIQHECPVCLQILREPYQVDCCGYQFCRVCIEKIHSNGNPCPICKQTEYNVFHDKCLQRSLYSLSVHCSHKLEGCKWQGELRRLDDHLNLFPQPVSQLKGCVYSEIMCIYCSKFIKRLDITAHQNDHCFKRPFRCEFCHSYKSSYEDVVDHHQPLCALETVKCPNGCGTYTQRQDLGGHIDDCPNTVIECPFNKVGCKESLCRSDMKCHLTEKMSFHMCLLANEHSELMDRVKLLERENEALRQHVRVLPVDFVLKNFEQRKKDDEDWYSPPFYTYPRGYQLCLRVDANSWGNAKGTHIGVAICLMRGDFDDDLNWPFCGKFAVQLLDKEGNEHINVTIDFTHVALDITCRVTEGERNPKGWGKSTFVSLASLTSKYLIKDCLSFRVSFI